MTPSGFSRRVVPERASGLNHATRSPDCDSLACFARLDKCGAVERPSHLRLSNWALLFLVGHQRLRAEGVKVLGDGPSGWPLQPDESTAKRQIAGEDGKIKKQGLKRPKAFNLSVLGLSKLPHGKHAWASIQRQGQRSRSRPARRSNSCREQHSRKSCNRLIPETDSGRIRR